MAWFPCNIGGGSVKDGDGVLILENGQISDTSQYLYPTYTDLSIYKIAVARVIMDRNGTEFVGYGIIDCSDLPSDITVILYASGQSSVSISITFSNTSITQVRYPGDYYNTYLDIEVFDFGYAPKPTVKQGTFVSASSQHGIVDVNVGFKPDLIMVKLPLTGGDTISYWEKDLSYAQNTAIWCLKPAEDVAYAVTLGRQNGETGIQAINNNGFSFMSNGANTQGITCEYIAIKYEAEQLRLYTNSKYYTTQIQITDVSGFTKLYSTDANVEYGSRGAKVNTALGLTDESTITSNMNGGWQASSSCYYDSEEHVGAYGGYNFGEELFITKAKFWLGRYEGQNKTLTATIQYLDSNGNWHDINTVDVTTNIPYPLNIFEVNINNYAYGIRWIHNIETKTSGNNICFFGMTLYEGSGAYIDVYVPDSGLNELPEGYDGFGPILV